MARSDHQDGAEESGFSSPAWLWQRAWDRCANATPEQAKEAWEEVLYRTPREPLALNNLATVCFHMDLMDEAVRFLADSVKALPDHGFLWASLGWVYWHVGRAEGSRYAFRAAIDAAPMFEDYGLGEEKIENIWRRRCLEPNEATLGEPNLNLLRQSRASGFGAITLRDPDPGRRRFSDRPDITLPRLLRRVPRFTKEDGSGEGGSPVPLRRPPKGSGAKAARRFPSL